jgi:ribosomal protein L13E
MDPKVFSSGKMRGARGFSTEELKKAKFDIRVAKRLGLKLDYRRKTAYEDNIRLLKERLAQEKTKKVEKKKAKKGKAVKGKKPIAVKKSSK